MLSGVTQPRLPCSGAEWPNLLAPFLLCHATAINCQLGWQDGSGAKGTCCHAWGPEFNPWNAQSGRRELTPLPWPMTFTHATPTPNICFFKRAKERVWSWVGGERSGKSVISIYSIRVFFPLKIFSNFLQSSSCLIISAALLNWTSLVLLVCLGVCLFVCLLASGFSTNRWPSQSLLQIADGLVFGSQWLDGAFYETRTFYYLGFSLRQYSSCLRGVFLSVRGTTVKGNWNFPHRRCISRSLCWLLPFHSTPFGLGHSSHSLAAVSVCSWKEERNVGLLCLPVILAVRRPRQEHQLRTRSSWAT